MVRINPMAKTLHAAAGVGRPTRNAATSVAALAGGLSVLGEDADRVVAAVSLPVPPGGGGGGEICVLILNRPSVCSGRTVRPRPDSPSYVGYFKLSTSALALQVS
jgi:hypothetical protein